MKKNVKVFLVMCIMSFAFFLAGCDLMQTQPDGSVVVDPQKVEKIDQIAAATEAAGQVSLISSTWLPILGPIGGLLVGAAGAWRKMKPQVEQAQSEAEIATSAGQATATAIEEFKKKFPDEWERLEVMFEKYQGPEIENFYRALRGLPSKK